MADATDLAAASAKQAADAIKLWHDQGKHLSTVSGVLLAALAALFYSDAHPKFATAGWYVAPAVAGALCLIGSVVVAVAFLEAVVAIPHTDGWEARLNDSTRLYKRSSALMKVGVLLFLLFLLVTAGLHVWGPK